MLSRIKTINVVTTALKTDSNYSFIEHKSEGRSHPHIVSVCLVLTALMTFLFPPKHESKVESKALCLK